MKHEWTQVSPGSKFEFCTKCHDVFTKSNSPYCPGPNEKGSTMKGHVFSPITGDCIQCGSMWQTTTGIWGECKELIPGQEITTNSTEPITIDDRLWLTGKEKSNTLWFSKQVMSDTEKDCDCQELLKGHNPECPYLLNKDLVD